jgi:hypothetical protein
MVAAPSRRARRTAASHTSRRSAGLIDAALCRGPRHARPSRLSAAGTGQTWRGGRHEDDSRDWARRRPQDASAGAVGTGGAEGAPPSPGRRDGRRDRAGHAERPAECTGGGNDLGGGVGPDPVNDLETADSRADHRRHGGVAHRLQRPNRNWTFVISRSRDNGSRASSSRTASALAASYAVRAHRPGPVRRRPSLRHGELLAATDARSRQRRGVPRTVRPPPSAGTWSAGVDSSQLWQRERLPQD